MFCAASSLYTVHHGTTRATCLFFLIVLPEPHAVSPLLQYNLDFTLLQPCCVALRAFEKDHMLSTRSAAIPNRALFPPLESITRGVTKERANFSKYTTIIILFNTQSASTPDHQCLAPTSSRRSCNGLQVFQVLPRILLDFWVRD